MARRSVPSGPTPVDAYRHPDKRVNIPTADAAADWIDEEDLVLEPLHYPRNPELDPQLVWRGKDAQDDGDLVVDAPPLYRQESIDPRVLIENLRRVSVAGRSERNEEQPALFDSFDDFDGLDELSAIEFYQHQANWSNRMILGDSLQVMGSLAEREQLRGKVQMIYIDPPYGIKFGSNWQVSARKRDVKDGKIEDAAREAEQIKAFRDTWADGIHTYLSYLRDRLVVARDLLTESGSIFVQIGDENVHLVRSLLDEVFGSENLISQIPFVKTSSTGGNFLDGINDYLLWYGKERSVTKYRQLYQPRSAKSMAQGYTWVDQDGHRRRMTAAEIRDASIAGRRFITSGLVSTSGSEKTNFEYELGGAPFRPSKGSFWKTNIAGMRALETANRLIGVGATLNYVRYADDFPVVAINSWWGDTKESTFAVDKIYVVQTYTKVIERCMLMTTDPGDLVLDPTCGSGTTAYVAEQWGRRWITIDTSRVALALARQRLMGGKFPYYLLADSPEGRRQEGVASGIPLPPAETHGDIRQGFVYERVQHITLKSIANNPDIVEGMTREQIDAAIKRHADFELLYDKPYEDKKRVRVTGPFTVESLSPYRSLSFGEHDESGSERAAEVDPAAGDFTQTILDSLRASGIQNGRRNERIQFSTLDPHAGLYVQAIGERSGEAGLDTPPSTATRPPEGTRPPEAARPAETAPSRIAVAIGPQYGTVSPGFIKDAAREALKDPDVDLLCVLGFAFDPQATGVTEADGVTLDTGDEGFAHVEGERKLGRIKVLLVRMNAELLMGDALKKTGAGNLFTVFGEPDIELRSATGDPERLEIELHGVDVYDPSTGAIRSRQTDRVALWMIDTDYDDEAFFVRHCYFTGGGEPMKKLERALKSDIDPDAWEALYRTVSLPFDPPSTGKIAIKVINDYGDEVMKVIEVGDHGV